MTESRRGVSEPSPAQARPGATRWQSRVAATLPSWTDAAAAAALLGAAAASLALASRAVDPGSAAAFASAVVCVLAAVGVTGALAYGRAGRSLRLFAVSPFPLAALTWLVLFVLRPVELYVWADHSAVALSYLGFQLQDLTRATAIGGAGVATCCLGYLLGLGRARRGLPAPRPLPVSARGAAVALAVGTVLWAALFLRQGGFSALIHSPASIRVNQGASFYAFIGVWLVIGVTLAALAALLQQPTRAAKWVFAAGAALSLAASLGLQLRSLAAFGAVAALVVLLTLRTPRRRTVVLGVAAAVLAVVVLGVTQQVRAYSTTHPPRVAIELTTRTPVWAMYVSDLSTFDNLVAFQDLVPESIPYLGGRTLAEIPLAFVPRALWPEKPLGIDFRVSSYLYPGVFVAVPISLQGELFWNGGLPLVVGGALVFGVALGLAARFGLGVGSVSGAFLLYAVALPFTHGLLTRGLATTLQNLSFALVGVGIAAALTLRGVLPWRGVRARRAVARS